MLHWVLPRVKLSRDRGCWQWVVRMMKVWVYKVVFSSVVAVSIALFCSGIIDS